MHIDPIHSAASVPADLLDDDDDSQNAASSSARMPMLREQVADAGEDDAAHCAEGKYVSSAEHDARRLESLCTRLGKVRFDVPEQWLECFNDLASCRNAALRAAHAVPRAPRLFSMAQALANFLAEFERHVQGGAIDLGGLAGDAAATICNGLGMLSELVDCRVYGAAAQKPLRAIAARLSPLLVASIMKKGDVAMDREGTQATLALLTWFSRGLKARLLQADDASLRGAYRDALDAMATWVETPAAYGFESQQLATCFVQLNTIRQFSLLAFKGDGAKAKKTRERLESTLKALCAAAPKLLTTNGVAIANVCNALKDYLDAGLLPRQTHGWLMPVVALLLQRMPQIAHAELMARGGQVLANYGNFLRMLFEEGLHEQPAFIGCLVGYRQACAHLADMVRRPDFALHGDTGQSLANLLCFVKAMARMEAKEREKRKPADKEGKEEDRQRQALLNSAARRLLALLEMQDAARLSPISIGGMLSALGYLWASSMAPASTCRALTHKLFAALASCQGHWEEDTVALCMRAVVHAHDYSPADASLQQGAFLHLLSLLGKTRPANEGYVLYCLQALRLGIQQKWVAEGGPQLQAALRMLLDWKPERAPGAADLDAAIAGLSHREEAAPAMLESVEEASAPAPLPGQVGWTPPGGKLAALSSAPTLQPDGATGTRSTTYRAPPDTTAGAFTPSHTTSVTASTYFSSGGYAATTDGAPVASATVAGPRRAPADPVLQWFELASGQRHDAASLEAMRLLAKDKPALIHALDGAGNSALYYLIINGKRAAMAWLIAQPDFALGMPLEAFRARIEAGLLGSPNWNAAKLARQEFEAAARRLFGDMDQEEPDGPSQSAAAAMASSIPDASRVSKTTASTKHGKHRKARKAIPPRSESMPAPVPEREPPQPRKPAAPRGKKSAAEMLDDAYAKADAAVLRRLLRTEAGKAWASAQNPGGHNKLMLEAFKGDVRMIEALLDVDNGALAEQFSLLGSSALLIAAGAGNVEAVKVLLKFDKGRLARQRNTVDGKNALMMAAVRGELACVKVLLAWHGGKLAERNELTAAEENALTLAAQEGHADVVKVLLDYKEGELAEVITRNGHTAMTLAAEYGEAEVVRILLGWRQGGLAVCATFKGYTPLLLAAQEGHVTTLAVLLESREGAALVKFCLQDGRNALMLAAENGHLPIVKALIAFGFDLRACTDAGENALMLAAKNGHVDVVDALLQVDGAALTQQKSPSGETALTLAVQNGRTEVFQCLCAFDQTLTMQAVTDDAKARFSGGAPKENLIEDHALMTAVRVEDLTAVRMLLNQPLFEQMLNYQDKKGEKPVHLAARLRRTDIMKALIDKSDWSFLIEDQFGPSPFQIAIENRDAAMLELILDHLPPAQMAFVLGEITESGIGLALQNGDAVCLGLMLDRAQRAMGNREFAVLLRDLPRPDRDDAHRAALAMLNAKQAIFDARLVVGEKDELVALFKREVEQEFSDVRRMAGAAKTPGGS